MTSTGPTARNRLGSWALGLGIAGILGLMAPVGLAPAVLLPLGAAVAVAAVVLGITGVVAHSAGRAANRPQAVAGIVLGFVGSVLWVLAIVGMLAGVVGS